MSEAEAILKKKKTLKAELDALLPGTESDALWKEAEARLEEILRQYSSLPKGVKTHTHQRIFPAAAVYLTAREALGSEQAYRIIEQSCIQQSLNAANSLHALLRIPGMKRFFVRMWSPVSRRIFGEQNGFQNVFYPRKHDEFRMDIIACPYFRYFNELGCGGLTKIFCANDDRMYGNLPGLRFERSSTLGRGGERCDFHIRTL